MKTKLFFIVLIASCIGMFKVTGQGFQPPAEGKAVVYFCRVTAYGGAVSFEFFHQDKYIGVFKKKNYMRYELDPGEQLLWASSENKEFLTSELEAGKTYVVIVNVIMGAMKARVGLKPITADDEAWPRVVELVNSKPPVVTPQEKIDKMNEKLADFIAEKLKQYEEVWKNEKNFKHISPDMAIPEDKLK